MSDRINGSLLHSSDMTADIHRRALLLDQHSILLLTGQPEPLHHDRHRFSTSTRLHHRLSRFRQAPQFPQLHGCIHRHSRRKRLWSRLLHSEPRQQHQELHSWSVRLGRQHQSQLLRDQGDLGIVHCSLVSWKPFRTALAAKLTSSSILFTCSCILLPTLWFKSKRAGLLPIKSVEQA